MDANEFIDFASKLSVSQHCGAAGYRSAASRAYYGAFHLAKNFLQERFKFFCTNRDNEHKWVQQHFSVCDVAEAKQLGKLLENLHQSRKEADYHLEKKFADGSVNAVVCVKRADEIRDALARCAADDKIHEIHAQMLQWRQATKK